MGASSGPRDDGSSELMGWSDSRSKAGEETETRLRDTRVGHEGPAVYPRLGEIWSPRPEKSPLAPQ